MKKVTIVIPTFNQAQYLGACVDHCLFQTYANLELIVVDGGSTDGTKQYLEQLEFEIAQATCEPVVRMDDDGNIVREKRSVYPATREIKMLVFGEDIGATLTYNEGLRIATGEYCTYIVGDDIPHPHMIEELVDVLETTGADFAYSDMNLVNDQGQIVRQMKMPEYSFEDCFARWFHLGVSKLYRTELHDRAGLMDENYKSANDYDHYLRFAMTGANFIHLPKILYSIRFHGDDRKTGQHTDERYANLIDESKQCARRARQWLEQNKTG